MAVLRTRDPVARSPVQLLNATVVVITSVCDDCQMFKEQWTEIANVKSLHVRAVPGSVCFRVALTLQTNLHAPISAIFGIKESDVLGFPYLSNQNKASRVRPSCT
jgi:hypothetical protein